MAFVDNISRVKRKKKAAKPSRSLRWWWVVALIVFGFIFIEVFINFVLPTTNLITLFSNGKYLVLLQNNAEIRSSGGFIGSYAVVEIKNFQVKNINFETNIYALDREFAQNNFAEPPEALAKMLKGETWALRDSNYDASFPEASSDILKFYNLETGDSVDGIIAFNASVILDLLKISGPIDLEKYGITVTADNFYKQTQYQIEKTYYDNPENWVINEPKTILKDLYPEILKKITQKKSAVFNLVIKKLVQKEILLYFNNPQKEALVKSKNWAGEIPADIGKTDYLYLNSNSYSGNKSSLSVKENVDYQLNEIILEGQKKLIARLKISREHHGSYDWPDGKNINWERIYVSQNAQFLSAKFNDKDITAEIEIGTELDKNYFGYVISTEPGQANVLEITYQMPYQESYSLLAQKQSGITDTNLRVTYKDKVIFNDILNSDKNISR